MLLPVTARACVRRSTARTRAISSLNANGLVM